MDDEYVQSNIYSNYRENPEADLFSKPKIQQAFMIQEDNSSSAIPYAESHYMN